MFQYTESVWFLFYLIATLLVALPQIDGLVGITFRVYAHIRHNVFYLKCGVKKIKK